MAHNPIHVVHIIPTLRFGGAERCVVDIARLVDKTKFKITIIVLKNDIPLASELPADVQLKMVHKFKLKKVLLDLKPDIVHTHLFGGDFWGVLSARHLDVPIISTEHNINVGESWWRKVCKQFSLRFVTGFVASSEAIAADMRVRYGIKKDILVVHYGIELERWGVIPNKLIKLGDTINVLILGRLVKQKGHLIALEALKQLEDVPWKLSIVGDGELGSELKKEVARLALNERVEFFSATSERDMFIQEAHVLLVPSLWEGLGIVVMEAMAAGRVVIASDTGGIKEIITNNETGYLFPVGNVEAWARGLRKIFIDPESQRVALAGRKYAAEHFSVLEMIKKYEELYAHSQYP